MEKKSEKSLYNAKIQELQGEVATIRVNAKAYIDEKLDLERRLLVKDAIYITKNPDQKPIEIKKICLPHDLFDRPKEENPINNLITLNAKVNTLLECVEILKKPA